MKDRGKQSWAPALLLVVLALTTALCGVLAARRAAGASTRVAQW